MQRAQLQTAGWRVRPLLRVEYDRLVLDGVFQDQRVQLLEGELIEMSPQGVEHAEAIWHLTRLFAPVLARYDLGIQTPLAASDESEPEPDLAVFRREAVRRDLPRSARLVIEVAAGSLGVDLGRKARIYAKNGVPDYWVLDLKRGEIIVHRRPNRPAGKYASVRRYQGLDSLSPLKLRQLEFRAAELFPSRPKHRASRHVRD